MYILHHATDYAFQRDLQGFVNTRNYDRCRGLGAHHCHRGVDPPAVRPASHPKAPFNISCNNQRQPVTNTSIAGLALHILYAERCPISLSTSACRTCPLFMHHTSVATAQGIARPGPCRVRKDGAWNKDVLKGHGAALDWTCAN